MLAHLKRPTPAAAVALNVGGAEHAPSCFEQSKDEDTAAQVPAPAASVGGAAGNPGPTSPAAGLAGEDQQAGAAAPALPHSSRTGHSGLTPKRGDAQGGTVTKSPAEESKPAGSKPAGVHRMAAVAQQSVATGTSVPRPAAQQGEAKPRRVYRIPTVAVGSLSTLSSLGIAAELPSSARLISESLCCALWFMTPI